MRVHASHVLHFKLRLDVFRHDVQMILHAGHTCCTNVAAKRRHNEIRKSTDLQSVSIIHSAFSKMKRKYSENIRDTKTHMFRTEQSVFSLETK